jgi:thiamine-phosphate pyrophosphorylase
MPSIFPKGVYAILDFDRVKPALPDDEVGEAEHLLRYINDATKAGAVAVQFRAKSVPGHSLWLPKLIGQLRAGMDASVPLILNDHVAALAPIADRAGLGVHLGQDDATAQHGRSRLGDDALIGCSTHNAAQVATAQSTPANYLGFGPICATGTKSDASPTVGFKALAGAVAQSGKPIVAIGGIGLAQIPKVVSSGAHAAAVISAWLGDEGAPNGPNFARMAMQELVAAWRKAKRDA